MQVKEGQKIAKGAIVAQLRTADFQAKLDAVQGQLDQARVVLNTLLGGGRSEQQLLWETQERVTAAKLANARVEFDRYAGLVESGAASRSEFELAETNYRVAQEDHRTAVQLLEVGKTARSQEIQSQEAVVRELSGLVAEAKLHLEDGTLRAPCDGVVVHRFVDEGQSITGNMPVIKYASLAASDILIEVPDTAVASDICSPTIVGIHAEIGGDSALRYHAHIKQIAQLPGARAFSVRFGPDLPKGLSLRPGMSAIITLNYHNGATQDGSASSPIPPACDIEREADMSGYQASAGQRPATH